MNKIDNKYITLLGFIDSYINFTKSLKIVTEFTSKWAIEWLLIRLPENSEISIITGNLTPDLFNVIDSIYYGHSNSKSIEYALKDDKLKIGIYSEMKNKLWLFNLENQLNNLLTISGNSNLTEQGLWRKKGEENFWTFEEKDFKSNQSQWENIKSSTQWISSKTWSEINNPESLFKINIKCKPLPKIENILYNTKKQNISISRIQEIVSNYFKINLSELLSKSRESNLVLARQIGIYFSSELTENTATNIGTEFNRDHATVLYSKSKINKLAKDNPVYHKLLGNIRKIIINEIYSNEI